MDLGAFSQIDSLNSIMKANNIVIPRLRGLRLMKDEQPVSNDDILRTADEIGHYECESACESHFQFNPAYFELSSETRKIKKKYLTDYGIRWDRVHGYKRKIFKYHIRKAKERTEAQYRIFNKYCGKDDVLYIHARIGGSNWSAYDGPELEKQPWFLEKVDDAFDSTYCDIYAKIEKGAGD